MDLSQDCYIDERLHFGSLGDVLRSTATRVWSIEDTRETETMKKIPWLLLIVATASPIPIATLAQAPAQSKVAGCRIVDMVVKKAGEVDYVDAARVPGNYVTIDYLREREKASPRTRLLLFVTSSVKIQDIEGLRVIATGKMQYQDFHAYLYDPNRDSASEILYGPDVNLNELRLGPHGTVPWPGQESEAK
jgi:hypothetical protein